MNGDFEDDAMIRLVRRAQAAEHDRLVLFDELALRGERAKIQTGRAFDESFGIDTEDQVFFDREAWREAGYEPEHFVHYEASPERSIELALDAVPFAIESATFVDLGCGKGRAMLVAARRPFSSVIGVELNPLLVETARANIAKMDRSRLLCRDIDVVEAEASAFPMPEGDLVLYLYNPFDDVVLAPIVDRIATMTGRRVALAYNYPKFRAVVDRNPAFEVAAEIENCVVYRLASHVIATVAENEVELGDGR